MADGNMLGGGVVVALAAALWLAYLIPTWLRRREYMATERNAVRLQQTLRILAEAAEVPEEIHVEANARDIAETQKALRKVQQRAIVEAKERAAIAARAEAQLLAEKKADAEAQARAEAQAAAQARAWAAAEARARMAATRERTEAAERKARAAGAVLPANVARSIRRGRALSTGALLAGVVVFVVGALLGWALLPLAVGAALFLGALTMLARLSKRVTDARRATRSLARGSAPAGALYDHADDDVEAAAQLEEVEAPIAEPWTPRPLPRPLHLSRGTVAAATMASISAAAELRRAAGKAELEERAAALAAQRGPRIARLVPAKPAAEAGRAGVLGGYLGTDAAPVPVARPGAAPGGEAQPAARTFDEGQAKPAVPSFGEEQAKPASRTAPAASVAPDSRYARMGIVGDADAPALDLDAALRRRRAV
jgi:prepilin signal peptidase PulO-like enzyme (type II secretory pathway)